MPDATTLGVFALAGVSLLLVPGPAVLYIVTRSIDQGRGAGLVSVAGIHLGTVVHVAAGAIGLSAVVARSATAFTTIKLAGAAYLIAMGVARLVRRGPDVTERPPPASARKIFLHGAIVNILNPKTALFFLAFVPQFVDPSRGSVALQTIVLGLTFIGLGLLTDGMYATVAGTAGSWLRRAGRVERLQRWGAGSVYVALGVTAATAHAE